MKRLKIDCEKITDKLVVFLKDELAKTGLHNFILGLSGGIDSAVVIHLLAKAADPKNIYTIAMPYKSSNPNSLAHARLCAEKTGVNFEVIEITPMVDAYFDNYADDADALRKGNRMARERMCILYDQSAKYNGLVVGTGNKTETLLGYGTLYGDMACAINPIGNFYKNQVYQLAKYLGIPEEIIDKPPSADLWIGQTDEDELGMKYDAADKLLYMIYEENKNDDDFIKEGFSKEFIKQVKDIVKKNEFKSRLPIVARFRKGD